MREINHLVLCAVNYENLGTNLLNFFDAVSERITIPQQGIVKTSKQRTAFIQGLSYRGQK